MSAKDKIRELRDLVRSAEANGSLDQRLANAFWNVAGRGKTEPATPAPAARAAAPVAEGTAVTVSLRATGVNGNVTSPQAAREVERALSGVAGQAGARVIPGSVRISV